MAEQLPGCAALQYALAALSATPSSRPLHAVDDAKHRLACVPTTCLLSDSLTLSVSLSLSLTPSLSACVSLPLSL